MKYGIHNIYLPNLISLNPNISGHILYHSFVFNRCSPSVITVFGRLLYLVCDRFHPSNGFKFDRDPPSSIESNTLIVYIFSRFLTLRTVTTTFGILAFTVFKNLLTKSISSISIRYLLYPITKTDSKGEHPNDRERSMYVYVCPKKRIKTVR